MAVCCTLCRALLHNHSSRRIISSKSLANSAVREFFLEKVCPVGYHFTEGVDYYVCRLSCYRQIEKAAKLQESLHSILSSLRSQASINCVSNEDSIMAINSPAAMPSLMPLSAAPTPTLMEIEPSNADVASLVSIIDVTRERLSIGEESEPIPKRIRMASSFQEEVEPETAAASHMTSLPRKQPCNTPISKRRLNFSETPCSSLVVSHVRRRQIIRKYKIHSPYKDVVKSMRYKNDHYIARKIMKSNNMSQSTIGQVCRVVRRECEVICKIAPKSNYRVNSIDDLLQLEFRSLVEELRAKAPILTSILEAAAENSSHTKPDNALVCMVGGILLKSRCKHMCKLQMLVSSLLYAGHASKRVYTRLQKLGICLSHTATLLAVKKMGLNHDKLVQEWTSSMSKEAVISSTNSKEVEDCDSDEVNRNAGDESSSEHEDCDSDEVNRNVADESPSEHDDEDLIPDAADDAPNAPMSDRSVCIIGDNLDKNINPRCMRSDHQVKSLHLFHSVATFSRMTTMHLDDNQPLGDLSKIAISEFLPSLEDCASVRDNFVVLAARVVVENFTHFSYLQACVPNHILHEFSSAMKEKTQSVPLGVIPKNENVREEIIQIMEELQKYAPKDCQDGEEILKKIAFFGDQLTVERARASKKARVASYTAEQSLDGLEPAASDWHAEANFLQTIFSRLFKAGSSFQGGTLLQLRNLINRRNVRADTSQRFNETVDFFQLAVECHIMAAAMHFYTMSSVNDAPSTNSIPSLVGKSTARQWSVLRESLTRVINRYVLVDKFATAVTTGDTAQVKASVNPHSNPHASRIASEHTYSKQSQAIEKPKRTRKLPHSIVICGDETVATDVVRDSSPDGVFNYASAVLNDGLLLLELRDAIHEGDGPRIIRCWKFMILHWWHAKHVKYTGEAIHLIGAIKATASRRIAHELLWCRTVNTRGGAGNNIPVDLFLEHLNRSLKEYVNGIGPNKSINTIVQASKSLKCLLGIASHYDHECGIKPASIHHSKASSAKDREAIMNELCKESKVFDYIPGRYHYSFKNISPHISSDIQVDKLTKRIKQTLTNISNHYELKKALQRKM